MSSDYHITLAFKILYWFNIFFILQMQNKFQLWEMVLQLFICQFLNFPLLSRIFIAEQIGGIGRYF